MWHSHFLVIATFYLSCIFFYNCDFISCDFKLLQLPVFILIWERNECWHVLWCSNRQHRFESSLHHFLFLFTLPPFQKICVWPPNPEDFTKQKSWIKQTGQSAVSIHPYIFPPIPHPPTNTLTYQALSDWAHKVSMLMCYSVHSWTFNNSGDRFAWYSAAPLLVCVCLCEYNRALTV